MLAVLIAVIASTSPLSGDAASLVPCAPHKQTPCYRPARNQPVAAQPVGERCHPDAAKADGCRDAVAEQDTPRDNDSDQGE